MKKKETFQMRMSAETKEQLDKLKNAYQISAAAVMRMLIAKEVSIIEEAKNE